MNSSELMQQFEARYDRLQARSEAADEAYCVLADEVEASITFDALLEVMVELPDSVKKQALRDAAQAQSTDLFVETYERLLETQTGRALQRAIDCAYQRKATA
ncbi:ATP synthase subunit alpha [Mycoavidus cysteinexigens]|uniref:ATP synthase subunit alpha n=1 Tax=Mycoavidus cysteinexigens TaxID=1553431 RepID=A0A2Z6EVF2_9BURK|nr:hypothetical protein [Mycoavidus cysteinexigens]BBE09440.1 ATP synthase subunit alpha [Mycoavidus cysteinexigens]GAM51801.1 hypothetical protein EBME_0264 [bacterium endosymbiont of Mortierella elongata FMR23-6]GLR01659.1 hypothetical protein GCM10007934_14710 [Mycoavidus cysteinexigens]